MSTREMILENAIQLFKENGYQETTVVSICKKSNITKGTFYKYFKDKNDIIMAFYAETTKNSDHIVKEILLIDSTKEQLWKIIDEDINTSMSLTPKLMKALFLADMQEGLTFFTPFSIFPKDGNYTEKVKLQLAIIEKGQRLNEIKQGDPEAMLFSFIAAEYAIANDWCCHDGNYDEKPIIREVFDTIF